MKVIKFINEEWVGIKLKDYKLEFPNSLEENATCMIHLPEKVLPGYIDLLLRDCCCEDILGVTIMIPDMLGIEMNNCRFCNDLFIVEHYPHNINDGNLENCPCRVK